MTIDKERMKKVFEAIKFQVGIVFILGVGFIFVPSLQYIASALSVLLIMYSGYNAAKKYKLDLGGAGLAGFLTSVIPDLFLILIGTIIGVMIGIYDSSIIIVKMMMAVYSGFFAIIFGLTGGFIGQKI